MNVQTIEDPIEMIEPSFNQMQVQHNIDLTFASGVRALLRQDPDIIMVGEIRDLETAEMAIQAALTGHLVLHPAHQRLAHGDHPPARTGRALLPDPRHGARGHGPAPGAHTLPALQGADATGGQRLARTTRPWSALPPSGAHQAVGCLECRDTGYRGAPASEIMLLSDSLKELITADTDLVALRRQAYKEGTRSLRLSGAQKVAAGISTLEEVLRVTPAERTEVAAHPVGGVPTVARHNAGRACQAHRQGCRR